MKNIFVLGFLVLVQSCLGPGIGKVSDKEAEKPTFTDVVSMSPLTNGYNPLPSTVSVNFPSSVDMNSVSVDDFIVTGSGNCPSNMIISGAPVVNVYTLVLNTSTCRSTDTVTVKASLENVYNTSGLRGSGLFWETYTLMPHTAFSPVINLVSGYVKYAPAFFTFLLDSSIDLATVTHDMVELLGTGGCPADPFSSISHSGLEARVNLNTTGCSNGDEITVRLLNTKMKNLNGESGVGVIERKLIIDNVAPQVSDILFNVVTGYYNPLPNLISVTFPNEVDMDKLQASAFRIRGMGTCAVNALSSFSKVGHVVTLAADTTTCLNRDSLEVELDMTKVEDLAGNTGSGLVTKSLTLLSESPASPNIGVASGRFSTIPSVINMVFSNVIDMTTVNSLSILTSGTGGCATNPFLSVANSGINSSVMMNTAGCQNGDSITLRIDMTKIKNILGLYGSGIITRTFTLDTAGPLAPLMNVLTGQYSTLPTILTFVFGADTDMSTVSASSFTAAGSGSCPVNALASIVKVGQTATMTLNTSGCANGNSIAIGVALNLIQDLYGNAGVGSVAETLTYNNQVPGVPSINVAPGTYATLPSSLQFTFAGDINIASVGLSDFSVQGTNTCSPVISSLGTAGQVVTLNLAYSTCGNQDAVMVSLNMVGVLNNLSVAGNGISRFNFVLDNEGPNSGTLAPGSSVAQVIPTNLTAVLPSDTDMSTVSSADFAINSIVGCAGAFLHNFSNSGTTVTFSLDWTTCSSGDQVQVRVNFAQIKDLAGNFGSGNVTEIFELDTQGPDNGSILPDSGNFQTLPISLAFTFPNDVLMSTVDSADISFSGTGGCSVVLTGALSKTAHGATANVLLSNCSNGTSYTVFFDMAGVTDAIGNPGNGIVQETYVHDSAGPMSGDLAVLPLGGSRTVLPTSVNFTFGSDIDMTSVSIADFVINNTGTCPAQTGSVSLSGQVATLALNTAGCTNDSTLVVTVNLSGIKDKTGNGGSGYVQQTYKLDNAGPAAAVIDLASGTFGVMPTVATITFSADTLMTSFGLPDLTILGSGSCHPSPLASHSVSGQVVTLNFNTTGCASGDSISVALAMNGITDALANAGSGVVSASYKLDNVGPVLLASPTDGTVRTLPAISYTFNDDADMSTVTQSDFQIVTSGSCLSNPVTNFSKTGQNAAFTFSTASCATGDTISIALNLASVQDAAGNSGSGTVVKVWTFDVTGPASATATPSSATLAALPSAIIYSFSGDTDMNSVTVADFTGAGTGACPSNPVSSISKSGSTATVNLSTTGCIHGNSISVSLNMAGVTDSYGNPGSGTISRAFTLDKMGPANPTSNPAGGILALFPSNVILTFPADTDMSTVTASDISIETAGLCGGATLSNFAKTGNNVSVTVTSACVLGTITLKANMGDIKDTLGNAGVGFFSVSWLRVL